MVKTRSYSRLPRFGIVLLPWLPIGVAFAAVWSYLGPSVPVLISTVKMVGNSPPTYTSSWEQAEQAYPHIHMFAAYLLFAALAFVVGIAIVAASLIRHRRLHADSPPTI
jgi:hypothetical protein